MTTTNQTESKCPNHCVHSIAWSRTTIFPGICNYEVTSWKICGHHCPIPADTDIPVPQHVLITPETCDCDKLSDYPCPVCDGGLAICSVCRKAEAELDRPCAGPATPAARPDDDPDDLAALIHEVNAHPLMERLSEAMQLIATHPDQKVSESWHVLHRLRKELRAHIEGLCIAPASQTAEPTANDSHPFLFNDISSGLCWCGRARGNPIHQVAAPTEIAAPKSLRLSYDPRFGFVASSPVTWALNKFSQVEFVRADTVDRGEWRGSDAQVHLLISTLKFAGCLASCGACSGRGDRHVESAAYSGQATCPDCGGTGLHNIKTLWATLRALPAPPSKEKS